ncbi:M3 family metallopeptidase [Chitinivorax sp. PXF-14]|uniref:M3 family metallopeptidase n=1 Tax=Chitinivorax sp. PXF-14 TaxID=3230488 RepID=UPI0034658683
MKKTAISLACLLAVGQAYAAQPGQVPLPNATQIATQCQQTLADAKRRVASLEKLPLAKVGKDNTLLAWNQLDIVQENLIGPIGLLVETSPDAAVRKAADECSLKLSAYANQYLQSAALYARIKALQVSDPIDIAARDDILDSFESRGVNLPADKRARVSDILNRLDKLSQDFARNIRDNATKVAFSEAELKGVPAEFYGKRSKDAEGRYQFALDYPENDAIMGGAENEATRRAFYTAFNQRGGEANLKLLGEAVALRKELAGLFGFDSYADWSLKRKMVGSAAVVNQFLDEVQARVEALEKKELGELTAEKAAFTHDANAKLNRWDVMYYEKRLQMTRYSLDQDQVRAQFPTEPTIAWMMKVTSTLYGVEFRPNKQLKTWHPEVRGYDVFDGKSGQYLSSFYLDLFPRENKYKHAAAFPIRSVSLAAHRTPASALVTNFNRDGFNQDELETLFHEFGHVMHGVLSKTRYVLNAGTSVKRDFVEAPSQMYEEWARRPETLKLFSETCPSCKPIDPALIARMNEARTFGKGVQYARQRLYAAWDMALHGAKPVDPQAAWVEMEGRTPLGHVDGTMLPASFGHMMGGYEAGYYGYMWSEVLALDMLSGYGDNVMDAKTGARYRSIILEQGGQVPPMQLVEQFLGRKPNSDAFFREITGQRNAANVAQAGARE